MWCNFCQGFMVDVLSLVLKFKLIFQKQNKTQTRKEDPKGKLEGWTVFNSSRVILSKLY